ncbi:MAG: T9SS type A sorting domain-containing protein [Candidatus Marinimicrobia bacterium]|nr:T9SS type A sorting domain-containing protein [Candidatus Neomarinimicrobiota bacterium]MBL7023501.1 T9SS type A sorting domain-containing protein [Candidatus Neomarinimicrobiota bacterium]MBL7109540.1 T9SS type A sorting domain-containing protein [Candidatus Neomarinimicrobiota bacterium]
MKNIITYTLLLTLSIGFIFAQQTSYILCEGNYQGANASLWMVDGANNLIEGPNNPVGDTGQSMTVDGNRLYIINNGSSSIEIYDISEDGTLSHYQSVSTNFSGPREMTVLNEVGYITEWYSESIAVLDLETFEFFEPISVAGMPEDIVTDGTYLYTSIIQNSDWSAGNQVLTIDPSSNEIVNSYIVGDGPGQMLIHDNFIFVTNMYYDDIWNTYSGTSNINLETGEVLSVDHGLTFLYNADLAVVNNDIYRMWESGIQQLDDFLNFVDDSQIGEYADVYSMAFFNDKIYFGLSDYSAPDNVVVLDDNGTELANYEVGAIPGSFAFFENEANNNNQLSTINYQLVSAYPNPFNPKTVISYQLMVNSDIALDIYNVNGQLVETLVNSRKELGYHQVIWNASNQPSGIYFAKLIIGEKSQTQKLMLLK